MHFSSLLRLGFCSIKFIMYLMGLIMEASKCMLISPSLLFFYRPFLFPFSAFFYTNFIINLNSFIKRRKRKLLSSLWWGSSGTTMLTWIELIIYNAELPYPKIDYDFTWSSVQSFFSMQLFHIFPDCLYIIFCVVIKYRFYFSSGLLAKIHSLNFCTSVLHLYRYICAYL